EEEFSQLEAIRWSAGTAAEDGESYLRVKGAKGLRPRELAAFRELHRWRERLAENLDRAPFRVIGNDALLAVSRLLPDSAAALGHVKGLPASLARRHGADLVDAVRRARALPESELPRLDRPARYPKDPQFDVRVERMKEARNRVAAELGLEPGVLCGRTTLEAVARAAPKDRAGLTHIGELRRW